ncbi:MAG: hypothetical protein AAF433_04915 [Bacteroidota bacterium]
MLKNTNYAEEFEYAATNSELCINEDAPIRWRIADRSRPGQQAIIWSALVLFIALFFISKPATTSPFITAILDLLDKDSDWAIPLINNWGASWWLGLLFILLLTFLLAQMQFGFRYSGIERKYEMDPVTSKKEPAFYRRIYLRPVGLRKGGWVFWLMAVTNIILFVFLRRRIADPDLDYTGNQLFSAVYILAILSRLVALFWGVGTLIKYFLNDYGRRIGSFLRLYARYFYPPAISILIIVYIVSSMDQFDSLFIELVHSPFNLLIFTLLLFPASIVVVWFTPNYLWFTDFLFSNRLKIWFNLKANSKAAAENSKSFFGYLRSTVYLHKRLTPQHRGKMNEAEVPVNFSPFRTEEIDYPTEAFNRTRIVLGLLYIFSLTGIALDVYFDNSNAHYWLKLVLLGVATLGSLIYWFVLQNVLRKAVHPANIRWRTLSPVPPQGNRFNRLYDYNHRKKPEKVFLAQDKGLFFLGMIAALLSVGLLFATFLLGWQDGARWNYAFLTFTLSLVLAPTGFVWLAVFRTFFKRYTFDKDLTEDEEVAKRLYQKAEQGDEAAAAQLRASVWDRRMDRLDSWLVQIMLDFLRAVAFVFVVFFLIGLVRGGTILAGDALEWFSPLNIFLLVLNGLIAAMVLFDRWLLVKEHGLQFDYLSQQDDLHAAYDKTGASNSFWGIVIVLMLLMSWYFGNTYHAIDYNERTAGEEPGSLGLYTENFWERYTQHGNDGPILMIAADGGGLKACYWTMCNLLELDKMGLVDNNLFMTSGASGGNMGLAMYTYLKAVHKNDLSTLEERIRQIGSRNFLSGDLMAFVTRWPLRYIPDYLEPNEMEDRTEAMARAYFKLAAGESGPYAYDEIRRQPYSAIYEMVDYQLPLFVANTSRAEDGMRGIVHPFKADADMTAGMVDLSSGAEGWMSYPDAAFLSNRFPLVSPAARIKGKGHFLDAGQSDNSGLATIYQFLNFMKSETGNPASDAIFKDSSFVDNFFSRVTVLSMRNAPSRFTYDAFGTQKNDFTRIFNRSELAANTSTAINTGLTGVPRAWDDYLRSTTARNLGIIDTFAAINLPFRLTTAGVQGVIGGELQDPSLQRKVDRLNCYYFATVGCLPIEDCEACEEDPARDFPKPSSACFTVEPPLGRMIALPALRLMEQMVDYPAYQDLRTYLKNKKYD